MKKQTCFDCKSYNVYSVLCLNCKTSEFVKCGIKEPCKICKNKSDCMTYLSGTI